MQQLLQFIWKRRVFLLFIALQAVALTLTVRANRFQATQVMTSANEVTGTVLEKYRYVRDFINLNETNKNLSAENAALRSALKSSYFQVFVDRDTVVDTLYHQQFQFIDANVINSSIHKRNNYLTINRGRVHGVDVDMGVISDKGVVGVVTDVSDHFATVIPLIHGRTRLSGKFQKNPFFGSIQWPSYMNYSRAQLSDIPRQAEFQQGDTVVSDTRSGLYPSGIPIGIVDTFYIEQQDQFYEVELNLTVDFAALNHVFVVVDLFKGERDELENNRNDGE